MPSMLTVKDARSRAARRVTRDLRHWAVTGGDDAVFELPLNPPTERAALADQTAAMAWARSWDAVDGVEWGIRRWPSLGTQRVPTRLVRRGAASICAFVGRAELRDWQTLSARIAAMVAEFGSAAAVTATLRTVGRTILDLDEVDFARLCSVIAWLSEHPQSGYRIRQLPVRGVDTKWVGRHRGLVSTLHTAISGRESLGLLAPPELIRLRFLDPLSRPAGLIDVSAPPSELTALTINPRVVVVVENLETLLALPELDGAVAVYGGGFGAGRRLAALSWVAGARLLYWGDLDSHGFAILDQLRSRWPQAESLLMDVSTLGEHRDLWVNDPKPTSAALTRLTSGESAALELLRAQNHARLEQERIPWAYVQRELERVFQSASPNPRGP